VFHEWQSGLFKVPSDSGTAESLTTVDRQAGEIAHIAPHALPGGRAATFVVTRMGRPPSLELVELSTGARKQLIDGSDPHYLTSGHIVFTRGGRLYLAPFDMRQLQITGSPAPVADDISVVVVQDRGALSVALDGTLAYLRAATQSSRLVAVKPNGERRTLSSELRRFIHPRVSPDGARLVVTILSEGSESELWLYDLEGNRRVRASVNGLSRPIWSHDGKRITFQKDGGLYSIPSDDTTPPEVVLARDQTTNAPLFPLAWSRDGTTLVYSRPAPGTNRDVFTLPVGGAPRPFLVTTRDERSAMLSPNGSWMVYSALETGREEEVYVQPFPGPGERLVVSEGGGREPVWSPRGDAIFYRSPDGQRMMTATVRTQPTFRMERATTLFQGTFRTGLFWAEYDVHPKTGEFLMLAVDEPSQPQLTIAVNWLGRSEPASEHTGDGR
jgi:eukaryotic-like serine/threonine-protein kinase